MTALWVPDCRKHVFNLSYCSRTGMLEIFFETDQRPSEGHY